MQQLLRYAQPLADRGDMLGLHRMLARITIPPEQKAERLIEVSYSESLAGRYRNARTAAVMAYVLQPRSPRLREQLAARLRTSNDASLLLALIEESGRPADIPIPLLLAYAAQLSYLNLQDRALTMLDEARRGDPAFPPTLLSRAQILTYLGRLQEAAKELERCIGLAPEIGQAHWFLAHLTRVVPGKNHVQRLRRHVADASTPPAEVASFAYALHKELDDLGDTEGAWIALEQACAAKRSTLKYAPEDSRRLVDALIASPVPATGTSTALPLGKMPVFIMGMHRSGTTLLEQLLDAHPQVHGAGELYDFTSAMRHATDHHCQGVIDQTIVERAIGVEFAEVGQRYLDGMAWRLGEQSHFTDKLPSNFLNAGFICQALPQAKILHMVRDPVETCFSNLREMFSSANAYSYDQGELADYFIQYRRLMAHWRQAYPGRIFDVDYTRLTADPAAVMREVADFCGLDYVPGMCDTRSSSRAVATASAVQVREGVVRRERPKWMPYAHHLQPLITALRQGGLEIPDGSA